MSDTKSGDWSKNAKFRFIRDPLRIADYSNTNDPIASAFYEPVRLKGDEYVWNADDDKIDLFIDRTKRRILENERTGMKLGGQKTFGRLGRQDCMEIIDEYIGYRLANVIDENFEQPRTKESLIGQIEGFANDDSKNLSAIKRIYAAVDAEFDKVLGKNKV